MTIDRKTPTIGANIISKGSRNWGTLSNENWDLVDTAIASDRTRLESLENTSSSLPLAIAARVGHNLLRNNIFQLGTLAAPETATNWTTQFLNGAVGYSQRDASTSLVGTHSQRIFIANVDTSPSQQTRPYSGLNILDPETNITLSTTDSRQLTNGFGYLFQAINLSSNTFYTLSAYGKADISNSALGINIHWKVGIVFKDTSDSVIHSYFTAPQTNRTNLLTSESFKRCSLTFKTPNLPIVKAEVWLVAEGSVPAGIGSVWIDGIQLEQTTNATALDTFSAKNGNLYVDGNLVVGGNLVLQQQNLIFDSTQVSFTGNIQLGDNNQQDTLDVYAKSSIFHGPLTVEGDVALGNNPLTQKLDVSVETSTFFNNQNPSNPQGGNVIIQGNLQVDGDTILGSNSGVNTVTIKAKLVQAENNFQIDGDIDVLGSMQVSRSVELGTNAVNDGLIVNMQSLGSTFHGNVTLKNNLSVEGDTTLGNALTDTVTIAAGNVNFAGSALISNALVVNGPTTLDIGTSNTDIFSVNSFKTEISATSNVVVTTPLIQINGSNVIIGSAGQVASITDTQTSFGTSGSPLTQFAIYSNQNIISGALQLGLDLTLGGNITSNGSQFYLGNSFSSTSGVHTLGNQNNFSSNVYNDQLKIFAGETTFGDLSTQRRGNVSIAGNLSVSGNTILGSSTNEDTLTIKAYSVQVDLKTSFKIGGGFQNNIYNPLTTDHGGATFDSNGNLSLDGKLTVKGPFDPTQIEINPLLSNGSYATDVITVRTPTLPKTTSFNLTYDGELSLATSLSINDGYILSIDSFSASVGHVSNPLLTNSIHAASTNIYGNVNISGSLDANSLLIQTTAEVGENLIVQQNSTIQGNLTAGGTYFNFGNQTPSLANSSTFNVNAKNITLGVLGEQIGDVAVGNDLNIANSLYVGFLGQYDNTVTLNAASVSIDVASYKTGTVDAYGFRVGGGFQNKIFNPNVLEHGGVTIDAYGNIFADGSLIIKGSFGYDNLTLTVPVEGYAETPVLTVIDDSSSLGEINLTIDGYGNLTTDGYLQSPFIYSTNVLEADGYLNLTATNNSTAPLGLGQYTESPDGYFFYLNNSTSSQVVVNIENQGTTQLSIDNFGNIATSGVIYTNYPGNSNLSHYSITVGDGYKTFGDFNTVGPINQSADPIQAAISFLINSGRVGTIFIKAGTYNISASGLTIPSGITLLGEGQATILDLSSTAALSLTGISCLSNSAIKNLKIQNGFTSIFTDPSINDVTLENLIVEYSTTAIEFQGNKAQATGCRLKNNNIGIKLTGNNNYITNSTVYSNSQAVLATGDENIILSNVIVDNSSSGLTITSTSDRNIVSSNVILRNPTSATNLSNSGTNTQLVGNITN